MSAIMEDGKNGRSTPKTRPRAKLPITDPLKVWVSGLLNVDGITKLMSAITENGKNGHSALKTRPRVKLPITDPPKVWVSGFRFSECRRNHKIDVGHYVGHYGKWEKWP